MADIDLQEAAFEATVPVGRGDYPKVGRIPIRNLWLLMLYASNLYRELRPSQRVSAEDNPDEIPDLAAEILTRAVDLRLRRNLSFAFQPTRGDLRRVRGSIDLLRTERRQLLRRGRVACRYEVLTVDTHRNRFVRARSAAIDEGGTEARIGVPMHCGGCAPGTRGSKLRSGARPSSGTQCRCCGATGTHGPRGSTNDGRR